MGKSREMFNREREQQSETLREFLDDTYQLSQYHANKQRLVLNEIFVKMLQIFGEEDEFNLNKTKSNEERNI